MKAVAFKLTPTETYTARHCLWIPGGSLAPTGFLTVTCVKRSGECDGPHTYGVTRDGPVVTVWKLPPSNDGQPRAVAAARAKAATRQRPYRVTLSPDGLRCDCRAKVDGCKHADATAELLARNLI